jgi:hypothetical protein
MPAAAERLAQAANGTTMRSMFAIALVALVATTSFGQVLPAGAKVTFPVAPDAARTWPGACAPRAARVQAQRWLQAEPAAQLNA